MKTYSVTCEVCGENGWACKHFAYGPVRHRDPQVCADNLSRQRDELEKRKTALEQEIGMRHTPGPWKFDETLHAPGCVHVGGVDRKLGYVRFASISRSAFGSSLEMPEEIARANARLIAAAPELYESCRELLLLFCATLSQFHVPPDLYRKQLDAANVAIAKAEGK